MTAVVETPVLEARGLTKHFSVGGSIFARGRKVVRAVEGVDIEIGRGETLGLVGESGCGKSTVGRLLLRLQEPTAGEIHLMGEDVARMRGAALRRFRTRMQIVFQDPFASLNPHHRVGDILAAPLRVHRVAAKAEIRDRVGELMRRVGLDPGDARKYPHEFSGGQRQRIGIARALALEPAVIVCDEPVSALDVSVQAQIVNLLRDLQEATGVSYLFISHDLAVVENASRRIAVMYLGRIVEYADRDQIFDSPTHPYTQALLAAAPIPVPGARRRSAGIVGEAPSPIDPPSGCSFHPRCPIAEEICRRTQPALNSRADGRRVACHLR